MAQYDYEIILGNANKRFSGVTSTMLQVLAIQQKSRKIAVLGNANMPASVNTLTFWQVAFQCRRPLYQGKKRLFHARRNLEMVQALVLKHLFRCQFNIVFTSTAQRKKSALTKLLMAKMDGIITTCEAANAYIEGGADVIIPHGVDLQQFYPAPDRMQAWNATGFPNKYGIGIFGRVRAQKGIDLFIDAALDFLPQHPNCTMIIIGEITPSNSRFVEDQKHKLKAHNLDHRVIFTDGLEFERIPPLFRSMSIVTALSTNEGFGLTVLEAMASNTVVVATKAGAWPDIIQSGKNGILLENREPKTLSQALSQLMSSSELRENLQRSARRSVEERYSVEQESQALLRFYDHVLDSRGGAQPTK